MRRIDDKQGRGLAGRPTPSPWGDLGLWALSLATAVGLWFFVNTGDGTEDRVMRVRIEPTNVPAGLVLSGTVTEYAELRVRGPSVIVAGIDQRRIRGEVDLSDAQPPRFREALTEKNFVLPRKVEVRKIAPPVAVFELDRLATRTLPVRLERRGEPPPGQIVGGVEIVPDHVEVVGPAEALAALRDVVTKPLDLATLGEGAQVDLDLDSAGALVRITPERVLVRVDLETTSADRRFPGVRVSLATVYNTLNQFVSAGLMKRITLDTERTYFDTNVSDHHHLFFEENGVLHDIPGDSIRVEGLPEIPAGAKVRSVEVIVRMTGTQT